MFQLQNFSHFPQFFTCGSELNNFQTFKQIWANEIFFVIIELITLRGFSAKFFIHDVIRIKKKRKLRTILESSNFIAWFYKVGWIYDTTKTWSHPSALVTCRWGISGNRCFSLHTARKGTMPKRGCNLLRWERSWDMCWGKVLTRQPEISQARREKRVGANRFFVGAPFKKCNPSGFNSTVWNDVSCYATILQRAPLVARPVHIAKNFADLSAKNYRKLGKKKTFSDLTQRRKNIVSLRESYFPRNDILSIFPDIDMKIIEIFNIFHNISHQYPGDLECYFLTFSCKKRDCIHNFFFFFFNYCHLILIIFQCKL